MLILFFPIKRRVDPSHPLLLIRLLLDGGGAVCSSFFLLTMFKIGLKFVVVVDGV